MFLIQLHYLSAVSGKFLMRASHDQSAAVAYTSESHIRTTLGAGPARPDADASDERIVELWLRDRPANTRVAYERDYGRFRAFIGPRSLRTVGLGDLSDFAATLTGSPATRRRTLSAIKALLTTGFKMGALRFNVGAALRLPKVVSRRAERRLEEIELFRLLTAVERKPPRSRDH